MATCAENASISTCKHKGERSHILVDIYLFYLRRAAFFPFSILSCSVQLLDFLTDFVHVGKTHSHTMCRRTHTPHTVWITCSKLVVAVRFCYFFDSSVLLFSCFCCCYFSFPSIFVSLLSSERIFLPLLLSPFNSLSLCISLFPRLPLFSLNHPGHLTLLMLAAFFGCVISSEMCTDESIWQS